MTLLLLAAMACSGPEYKRLDFWLGEWDVVSPSGKPEGHNVIRSVQDGCAVSEKWNDADGSTGESLFFFDRALSKWKQVWVTSDGGWKEKTEQPMDGAVRFAGKLPRKDGGTVLDRTTLTQLPGGKVRQLIEQSADGGKTWKSWEGLYTRKAPTPTCKNRDFDFWVGDWDVTIRARASPDTPWGEARGHNHVESTYGGCAIEEHFTAEGPGGPWAGHSVSVFRDPVWRQAWVDDSGAFLAFTGGMDAGRMVLLGEPTVKNGQPMRMRMVFSDIARDSLHWSWERTIDDGKTWAPAMTIEYRRHGS